MSTHPHTVIAKARELYIKYRGRCHREIEHEMHMAGCLTFTRRVLYSRTYANGRRRLGWIDKYGWRGELSDKGQVTSDEGKLTRQAETRAVASVSSDVSKVQSPKSNANCQTRDERLETGDMAAPPTADRQPPTSFPDWLKTVTRNMTWDWPYQQLIYEKLNDITTGKTKRLMIFLPPRHGKSELVTVRYSAWRLQQDPSLNIILGSYNQRLANRFSRKVRIVLEEAQLRSEPPASAGGLFSTAETRRRREKENITGIEGINGGGKTNGKASISSPSSLLDPPAHGSPLTAYRSSRARLNTVAEWETGLGGGVRAVGVGGGITGFGAGLVIIDDPVKSRAEAESKTYRDKVWEWFSDDLYTRLEPNASIILIQTRWHEDDLAGRLLRESSDGGEHWDVISLPALAEADDPQLSLSSRSMTAKDDARQSETAGLTDMVADGVVLSSSPRLCVSAVDTSVDHTGGNATVRERAKTVDLLGRQPGEALCPERFSRDDLLRIKRQLGTYSFSALYQQRPTPPEGGLFKRKWFSRIVDKPPQGLKWVRAYDLAVSTNTSADYTASFRCALDKSTGELYIADGFRKRIEFPEQRKFIVDRILNEPDTEHGIELALHGQAFIQDLRREHRLFARAFRGIKVTTDKFTRALSWANLAEEGKVILVRGCTPDRRRAPLLPEEGWPSTARTGWREAGGFLSANWIEDFLDEITTFPNSTHDDQIDAVSLAVQMLEHRKHTAIGF